MPADRSIVSRSEVGGEIATACVDGGAGGSSSAPLHANRLDPMISNAQILLSPMWAPVSPGSRSGRMMVLPPI